MATGADIPPELFTRIILDVCENAHLSLYPYMFTTVPNRKAAIKNVTACSLTCVYWAKICRPLLFWSVWIKNYEDMCTFRSLVSNTPTRFAPIVDYVRYATLVQRVGDRPWLHLVQMQPSFFRFWRFPYSGPGFYFHIEDSPNNATSLRSSTSRRLLASLPRTPPSSCLQCAELSVDNPHFVTPHDLVSFLQKFFRCRYLHLTNVAWSAQADFASDLLGRDPLVISPVSYLFVEVRRSVYIAETAWIAFSTTLRGLSTQASTVTSASEYDAYDEIERRPTLEVLSSAQRAIFDICKSLCKASSLSYASFFTAPTVPASRGIPPKDTHFICSTIIEGHEPAGDEPSSKIQLVFYGTQAVIPDTNVSDPIVVMVDSISILCAYIASTEGLTAAGRPSNVALPTHPPYSWAEIVGLCAAHTGFLRMQLQFQSHEYLVQFMEAQRAALGKLDGRIALFYINKENTLRAADFETLADLGDVYEHGYINPYD